MNYKPFNLEEAKAGKPVQLTTGEPVNILKFDLKGNCYPIIGIVICVDGTEYVERFTNDGRGLVMASEEKALFLNIYPNNEVVAHKTQKSADKAASESRIARVKVIYTEGQFDE